MESVPKASGAPWNIVAIHLQPAAVFYTGSLKRCPPEFQMRGIVLAIAVVTVAFLGDVIAQKTESLVGTWKLVYASASTPDGKRNDAPFGVNPTGFLTYTSEGRMSAMISYGGRKPLSSADRIT